MQVLQKRGNSSVGRAQPCQGWGREFEPRFPLFFCEEDFFKILLGKQQQFFFDEFIFKIL